jgi:hypothetical protein
MLCLNFFFFWVGLGFELRAGALPLKPHSQPMFELLFIFFVDWGLNSGPTPRGIPPALFCDEFFRDRVSQTMCLGLALNCDPPVLCFLSS